MSLWGYLSTCREIRRGSVPEEKSFFGNSGSAADALHLAAELVVRLRADADLRLRSPRIPSVLTAAGND
jgi:phosphoheptose isomerase